MNARSRRAPHFALALALSLAACAAPRPLPPARAQVRLDIAARALARARAEYEHACSPLQACDRNQPRWAQLDASLSEAELWLDAAQSAADAWSAGDGRRYSLVRPCLSARMSALADAIVAAGRAEPPGLRELEPPGRCELDSPP